MAGIFQSIMSLPLYKYETYNLFVLVLDLSPAVGILPSQDSCALSFLFLIEFHELINCLVLNCTVCREQKDSNESC